VTGHLVSVVFGAVTLGDVGRSLHEAFFMFWATFWALVLGFVLSGAVQAFVSKDQMQRVMGDHGPGSVARASGFGMVSSSCSYAASAMAKSLFQKGADLVSALVFMFASTNLVLELGIVLVVLMGWPFAAAEFVGGPIMIVLLALLGGVVLRGPLVAAARRRLDRRAAEAHDAEHDHVHDHAHAHGAHVGDDEGDTAPMSSPRTLAGWADASGYTVADLTMVRREILIGYVVAGFLSVMVPMDWWSTLFATGHGFWTSVENALVAPVIACISFVCSIGNVPMAAALWHGGISFGGVITFLFADLLALPLIVIYRKYYGGKLALRLVAVFYVVMVIAGLLVEGLFWLFGWIPTERPDTVVATGFHLDVTTVLNVIGLIVLLAVWWLHRHRARFGGGQGYAIDPVCGMQVRTADAPAWSDASGTREWFCSDRCRERYEAQGCDGAGGAPSSSNATSSR
jgi:uncharacterized membrane protein YraQ (UPF0718 family)/YHS domain-containing protein